MAFLGLPFSSFLFRTHIGARHCCLSYLIHGFCSSTHLRSDHNHLMDARRIDSVDGWLRFNSTLCLATVQSSLQTTILLATDSCPNMVNEIREHGASVKRRERICATTTNQTAQQKRRGFRPEFASLWSPCRMENTGLDSLKAVEPTDLLFLLPSLST
jgi:hypothetical protein